MSTLQLSPAGAPELVRSNQKDRFYTSYVQSLTSNLSQQLLPFRHWLRWERELQLLAELLYYGLTTVWGNQTLGEEYCNTVQVGPAKMHKQGGERRHLAPGIVRRTLAILLQLFVPYTLEKALECLYRKIQLQSLPTELSAREYRMLEMLVGFAEDTLSTFNQLHLTLFYIQGVFYNIGKRVAGIRYLMVTYGSNRSLEARPSSYRVLGWLIVCRVALKLVSLAWRLWRQRRTLRTHVGPAITEYEDCANESGLMFTLATDSSHSDHSASAQSHPVKCPLCLETCRSLTATLCGHLFCWYCVAEWVTERSECPVCRARVEYQQLVCLQHFEL